MVFFRACLDLAAVTVFTDRAESLILDFRIDGAASVLFAKSMVGSGAVLILSDMSLCAPRQKKTVLHPRKCPFNVEKP